MGGGGTPYNGLYRETPPERSDVFRVQLYERVGISLVEEYLTIIPRARMGSESIAHEAEWAIDSEAMRARGIIVSVKSN